MSKSGKKAKLYCLSEWLKTLVPVKKKVVKEQEIDI